MIRLTARLRASAGVGGRVPNASCGVRLIQVRVRVSVRRRIRVWGVYIGGHLRRVLGRVRVRGRGRGVHLYRVRVRGKGRHLCRVRARVRVRGRGGNLCRVRLRVRRRGGHLGKGLRYPIRARLR